MTPKAVLENAISRLPSVEYDQAHAALSVMVRRLNRLEKALKIIQSASYEVSDKRPGLVECRDHENTVVEDIENTPTSYASGWARRVR